MNTEKEIQKLKDRNAKVEADKAWETSPVRIGSIGVITYITTAIVFKMIGVESFLRSALIPTIGYILSTQSLPVIREWWSKNNPKIKNTNAK